MLEREEDVEHSYTDLDFVTSIEETRGDKDSFQGRTNLEEVDLSDTLGLYFADISRYAVLTPEQEQVFFQHLPPPGIRSQVDDSVLQQIVSHPAFSQDKRVEMRNLIEESDTPQNFFLNANLRLSVRPAVIYSRGSKILNVTDLIQAGAEGLIRAYEKFDHTRPGRGGPIRFSTYAVPWIKNFVTRAIMNEDSTIRIPIHKQELLKRVGKIIRANEVEKGEYLSGEGEISALLLENGLSEKQIGEYFDLLSLGTSMTPTSVDKILDDEDNWSLGEVLASSQNVERETMESFVQSSIVGTIDMALGRLSTVQQDVLRMRFGIGCERQTLEVVSENLGLPREQVRQVQIQALLELKKDEDLSDLLEGF